MNNNFHRNRNSMSYLQSPVSGIPLQTPEKRSSKYLTELASTTAKKGISSPLSSTPTRQLINSIQAEHIFTRLSNRGNQFSKESTPSNLTSLNSLHYPQFNSMPCTPRLAKSNKPLKRYQQQQQQQQQQPRNSLLKLASDKESIEEKDENEQPENLPKKCVFCQKKKSIFTKENQIQIHTLKNNNNSYSQKKVNRTIGGNTDDEDDENDEEVELDYEQEAAAAATIDQQKNIIQDSKIIGFGILPLTSQIEDDIDYEAITKQKELMKGSDSLASTVNSVKCLIGIPPRRPIAICRCDQWNHAHTSCLISRTIYNTFKCQKCSTITRFKTRRNYGLSILFANYKQRKHEVIGILRLFGMTSIAFFGYLIYFLYSLITEGITIEFFIRICCLLSFIMLFIYGLAFFINKIEKLSNIELASDMTFSDMLPQHATLAAENNIKNEVESNTLKGQKEQQQQEGLSNEIGQQQHELFLMNQFEINTPLGNNTPIVVSPIQSLHHSFSQSSLLQVNRPIQVANLNTWAESHLLKNTGASAATHETMMMLSPSQDENYNNNHNILSQLQLTQIPSQYPISVKTPSKRQVTVCEESPEYKLHAVSQSRSRPIGSCLKNGSFHSNSSGSSNSNKKSTLIFASTAFPNATTKSPTSEVQEISTLQNNNREKSHSLNESSNNNNNNNSKVFRPFESNTSTGNNTCRFGTGSLVLHGSNANPIIEQTTATDGNLAASDWNTFSISKLNTVYQNRRHQLQKAFLSAGTFFIPRNAPGVNAIIENTKS